MPKANAIPEAEFFHKRYSYDRETGELISLATGKPITRKSLNGYLSVYRHVNGKKIHIHVSRIIWVMEYGSIPVDMEIDHIDMDKTNNRLKNLRLCTPSENCRNKKVKKKTSILPKGVTKDGRSIRKNPYVVTITGDEKRHYIGRFKDEKSAAIAYNKASKKYHGQFGRKAAVE